MRTSSRIAIPSRRMHLPHGYSRPLLPWRWLPLTPWLHAVEPVFIDDLPLMGVGPAVPLLSDTDCYCCPTTCEECLESLCGWDLTVSGFTNQTFDISPCGTSESTYSNVNGSYTFDVIDGVLQDVVYSPCTGIVVHETNWEDPPCPEQNPGLHTEHIDRISLHLTCTLTHVWLTGLHVFGVFRDPLNGDCGFPYDENWTDPSPGFALWEDVCREGVSITSNFSLGAGGKVHSVTLVATPVFCES